MNSFSSQQSRSSRQDATLRAYIEYITPAQQRELINHALGLLAMRSLMQQIEAQLGNQPPSKAERLVFN